MSDYITNENEIIDLNNINDSLDYFVNKIILIIGRTIIIKK